MSANNSLETIVKGAKRLGYEFIGSTDHSQSLKIANGLSGERVKKKKEAIAKLNKMHDNVRIFFGTECDIKPDGSLDYSNQILKEFDFVYAGIHTAFKQEKKALMKRILTAMENEHVTFLAHPTGRMIGHREPFDIDIDRLLDKAKETGTFLEINAFPDRLDLNDIHVKLSKERGVRCVIGSHAHSIAHLPFLRFGIATARRGWLEKKEVLNTYSVKEIDNIFGG